MLTQSRLAKKHVRILQMYFCQPSPVSQRHAPLSYASFSYAPTCALQISCLSCATGPRRDISRTSTNILRVYRFDSMRILFRRG